MRNSVRPTALRPGIEAPVLRAIRDRLTYANVMATIALFVALGGSSYAVSRISGSQIRDNSISYKKLKRNTLGGSRIKESRLGKVRRARNADRLGGLTAAGVQARCPAGTRPVSDVCVEEAARAPAAYGSAESICRQDERRVATYEEINGILRFSDIALSDRGELTSNVFPASPDNPEPLKVLVVTSEGSAVQVVDNTFDGSRHFRCAQDPLDRPSLIRGR